MNMNINMNIVLGHIYIALRQIYIVLRQIYIVLRQIYDLIAHKYEYEYDNKYLFCTRTDIYCAQIDI